MSNGWIRVDKSAEGGPKIYKKVTITMMLFLWSVIVSKNKISNRFKFYHHY